MTPVLEARDLRVVFEVPGGLFGTPGRFTAVDGVSFALARGASLGLVGGSGCGKTSLARACLRLIPVAAGRVLFEGRDITDLAGRELRAWRRHCQIVFQDPYASLDPRMTVRAILAEPLRNAGVDGAAREARLRELLDMVGLPAAALGRFPHEFSGGQRQRIGIARALAPGPAVLVCDEPVSGLDLSIQAQVLDLLADLRRRLGLSMLFISHDLGVVRHVSDRVAVMEAGRIVEEGDAEAVLAAPAHPATRRLLDGVPGRRLRGEAGPA